MTLLLVLFASCSCHGNREFTSRADERYSGPPDLPDSAVQMPIAADGDDGAWSAGAFRPDGVDDVDLASADSRIVLRFRIPERTPAPLVARLALPVRFVADAEAPTIRIAAWTGPDADSPGVEPLTAATVDWAFDQPIADPYHGMPRRNKRAAPTCAPLYRYSPDLGPILAALPAGSPVTLVLEATHGALGVQDFSAVTDEECPGTVAPVLQLFPTLRSTLLGKELLSRPTDHSVTVTLEGLLPLDYVVDVWAGEDPPRSTEISSAGAEEPHSIVLDDLVADQGYRYRVRYRRTGTEPFESGPEGGFHTARAPGDGFVFDVTADGHLLNMEHRRAYSSMHLLESTFRRIALDHPDFVLDLGDSFNGESYRAYDAPDDVEVYRRDLQVRSFFELGGAPLFAVLGNHEGEQGWRMAGGDGLPERATRIRKLLYPAPTPDAFYAGNAAVERGVGFPQDYYAFTWGDTLIVVLDPYRYTTTKPHEIDGSPGSGDRWDWTLGKDQYDWLVTTLEQSKAPFKLVFAHQTTSGTNDYGRGGRMAADSFEWGAAPGPFAKHRPGWGRSVQQVLADTGVTAFFHGHDHLFAFEPPLQGVAYVTAPQPDDAQYDQGHGPRTGIAEGATVIENSGYLRLTVASAALKLEYVRSFLPGDGDDGSIAFTYTFTDCDGNGVSDLVDVARGRADQDGDGKPDDCHRN